MFEDKLKPSESVKIIETWYEFIKI